MFARKLDSDVFVIGGGPAGLATAIAARRKGFSVTLADGAAPPIDKPCGEGMMPGTQTPLRGLGVRVSVSEGHPFRGIRFVANGVRFAADFPAGQGIGIRRPTLHRLLVKEAENLGVNLLWRTPVRGIEPGGVQLEHSVFTVRWIIGADGSASRVRRWSGLDTPRRRMQRSAVRRHYRVRPWSDYAEVHWGASSQAYVTPISGEEVCIVVMAERHEDANFERALDDLPELRERLGSAELASRERGAITAMYSLRCVSQGNVALVGDASGGVDAITGEGLRLAFQQAHVLAEALEARDLFRYENAHRQLARRPRWMSNLMLRLAGNPWLRKRAMCTIHRKPELFERLLAIHVGDATPKDVLATGARFSWQFLGA